MKTCTKCGETKALTEFYKKKGGRDGLTPQCKGCENIRMKAYREANKEKTKARHKAYYEANPEKVKAQKKACYEANKEKIKAHKKAYCEANKEKIKARQKAWREANKEELKARHKAYYEANKEKLKAAKKAHDSTPAGRFNQYKGRAKQRNIPFLLTEEEFKGFWQQPCAYCGAEIETIGLDRIDSSGPYHIDNVVPCCWSCNQKKGTSSLEDWIGETLARAKRLNPEEFNK